MLQSLSGQLGDKSLAPVGIHCILELYGCPSSLLDDPFFVRKSLQEAAKQAKSTLLNEVLHEFEPQGVTALVLLAESHISIHTWPEQGYAAVDVFTCGQHTEPEKACTYLADTFQAREQSLCKLPRKPPIAVLNSMNRTDRTVPTKRS
ncbi:adenosylmethionine decarboxylase [Egbenema bharatensis]|uniref:adenosylmethionine decarboxylase n=1 Tax=Egbenema bharatensis TaxID=3463334 RepID=UPI003A8AC182